MTAPLFPEWDSDSPSGTGLVGIAKMAAESELVESKRRVEYRDLPARRLLSRCNGGRVPFQWTINPYRGCEFACRYCFARYTHEFMELHDPELFETRIFVKEIDWAGFGKELQQVERHESIGIGTATDPYQPAERRYRITRCVLEALAKQSGLRLYLTTKSDLITQDVKLLAKIARRNTLIVNLTVTTLDTELARVLEPYAPRPDLRLAAVHTLTQAGIQAGVLGSPILPMINDSEEQLSALAERSAKAGAAFFCAGVLFLQPCAKRVFFPFLAERFPELLERYQRRFAHGPYLRGRYAQVMQQRIDAVRSRFGLTSRADFTPPAFAGQQLSLF